jgi:hypothetical protein
VSGLTLPTKCSSVVSKARVTELPALGEKQDEREIVFEPPKGVASLKYV